MPWSAAWRCSSCSGSSLVWGSGPSDVYVVGDGGTLLHSTGNGVWTAEAIELAARADLNALWGDGPNDVYVVGARGTLLHKHR